MARNGKIGARATSITKRFSRADGGAVAPMFGMLVIPILTLTVFGIDLSRALTSRTTLQDAVDAAGLALAHMPSTTTQAQLDAAARDWITANVHDSSMGPITITVNSVSRVVTIAATSNVPSLISGMTHMLQIPIKANTTVKWGTKIELALVLDNTYSMNDNNKLVDLKSAATNLVNTLATSTASNPSDLKIGVVPFSVTVNVGSNYQNAGWITGTQPAAYGTDLFVQSATNRFTLLTQMGQTWGGCVESRPMPYDVQEDAPNAAIPATMFVPFFSPDEADGTWNYYGTWVPYMNNYRSDTGTDADLQSSKLKYTGSPRSGASGWGTILGPGWNLGPNMGCYTAPLLRMTTDMTVVRTKLNAMVATGETHIPIGLAWGWHVLSPLGPFSDGSSYTAPDVTKVAVLVTDGANTYFTDINGTTGQAHNYDSSYTGYGYAYQNRLGVNAFASSAGATTAINSRLTQLCTNMKARGIVLYTVPVQITDTTIKALLQSCASSPANYLEVTTSAGMQSAFSSIAGSISKLRISH